MADPQFRYCPNPSDPITGAEVGRLVVVNFEALHEGPQPSDGLIHAVGVNILHAVSEAARASSPQTVRKVSESFEPGVIDALSEIIERGNMASRALVGWQRADAATILKLAGLRI